MITIILLLIDVLCLIGLFLDNSYGGTFHCSLMHHPKTYFASWGAKLVWEHDPDPDDRLHYVYLICELHCGHFEWGPSVCYRWND